MIKNVRQNIQGQSCRKYTFFTLLLVIMLIITSCSNKNEIKVSQIKEHMILKPSFETIAGAYSAGTAFAIKPDKGDQLYVLTALHIFGLSVGLDRQYESKELPNFIKRTTFYDAYDESEIKINVKPIIIPGAKVTDKDSTGDLAAFKILSGEKLPYFKLSAKKPAVGDHVWLATSVVLGAPQKQKLHEAIVTVSNDKQLYFKYLNQNIVLTATSGSPILNSKCEVVGLNVGGMKKDKDIIGGANPLNSIAELLKNVIK